MAEQRRTLPAPTSTSTVDDGSQTTPRAADDNSYASDKDTTPEPSLVELLPVKGAYFAWCAGRNALGAYLALYLMSLGLPPHQVGILVSIRPFTSLVSAPAMGAFADTTGQHKAVLIGSTIVFLLFRLSLDLPFANSFVAIFVLLMLGEFFGGCITPLLDSSTLFLLGPHATNMYGRQRMWGAIGLSISSPLVGYGITQWGFISPFIMTAVLLGFLVAALSMLHAVPKSKPKDTIWHGIKYAFTDQPDMANFFIGALLMGTGTGLIQGFLFLYIDELGGDSLIMGIAEAGMALAEVPVFFLAGPIIRKIGCEAAIGFSMCCMVFRLMYYSFVVNPWMIVPVELLHGVTFGLMYSSSVEYVNRAAPEGMTATLQGLFSAMYYGLGFGVGNLAGGVLMGTVGLRKAFIYQALVIVAFIGYFLATIVYRLRQKRGERSSLLKR